MNAPGRCLATRITERVLLAAQASRAWGTFAAVALLVPLLAVETRAQSGPYLYLPNTTGNSVSVVDTATGVANSVATTSRSFSAAVRGDESLVYVSNFVNNTVTPINTATNTVGTPILVGSGPYGIAMTPDGTTVYVANNNGGTVSVINTANNTVTATITGFGDPTDVIVSPDGKTAYVTNQTIGKVTPIDVATNTAGSPINVGAGPFYLAISPDGKTIYVANSAGGTVSVINSTTRTVTATVTVGGTPVDVVVTPDGKTAYVTNQSTVTPIDTATNTAGTPISLGFGTTPFGLTVSPDGKTLYVELANGGGSVATIDTTTNTIGPSLAAAGGQFPRICSNGNALLAPGLTFKANTSGALACTLASGPTGSSGPVFTGGTLQFAGANISSALPVTLMSQGGTFDTAGNNATLSGAIGGPGSLTKIGLGTLTLSGSSTYSGPTGLNAGKLQAGTANVFSPGSAYTIANGATLDANSFNQTIGSLAGTGTVTLGSATLAAGNDNTNTRFSGAITGSGGLTKIGTGTFTLSGINAYTGGTTVDGGVLELDGSIAGSSSVTVNSSGALSSTGTVGAVATNIMSGGTLAPGNAASPTGTLVITGNLAFQSGALYLVHVTPSAAASTNVGGTAALAGTVNAVFASGSYIARRYNILQSASLDGTTFSGLRNTNLPAGFTDSLSYNANDAFLDLSAALGAAMPLNQNQKSVASAINTFFNNGGPLPPQFANIFGLTGTGLQNALNQLQGQAATGSQRTTFDAMNLFMGVMTSPFSDGSSDAGPSTPASYASTLRSGATHDAYAKFNKAPSATFEQRWRVSASGYGGSQSTSGNTLVGSNDTASSIYGTAIRADYRISPFTTAGFAVAGGGTNFSVAGSGGGHSDLFQVGAFIRHTIGPAYVSAALAYGWQDITTNRTVTVAGIDQLRAQFNANAFSGRIEGGSRFVTAGLGITPYAAARATTFSLPAYAEGAVTGADTFALSYRSKDVTDTRTELGARTDKSFALTDAVLTLRGGLGWAYDFNPDRNIGATFQALPGASFVVNGAPQAHNSALTTASAETKWMNGWSAAATFEGEFSDVTRGYAAKGVVRYGW